MFVDDYFFYNIEIDYNDIKKLSFLFVTEYNCHPVTTKNIDSRNGKNLSNIIDSVSVDVGNFNVLRYNNNEGFRTKINDHIINSINIILEDDNGSEIDINNHWSITLHIIGLFWRNSFLNYKNFEIYIYNRSNFIIPMALNNIDQLFNNIPDEYKFDIIGSYKEYKKTGSLTAYNDFMNKYNFYVNNMPSKSDVIYSDDEDEKLEFYEEKIKPKNLFKNRRSKNKILHDLYNKLPDNKIPNPETRDKMLILYLQIKNNLKNAGRKNMIKNDFIINRIFNYFGRKDLMEYVPAKLSKITFNKYLLQWKELTNNTDLPFNMHNIEIRKYKPKTIKIIILK